MYARLRRLVFLLMAVGWAVPAHADPLVLFLINTAREILTAAAKRAPAQAVALPEAPQTYAGTAVRPADLRRVIDASFVYLSERQRGEVFESLHGMLLDPKLAGTRAALIEYFMHK